MRFGALLLLLAACQNSKSEAGAASSPSATTVAGVPSNAPSASATPAASNAWFVGAWQGTFHAELFRVETAAGGIKEWQRDDGKKASGDGTLSLQVAPDGTISGNAGGALGELTVSGRAEADRAAIRLASDQTEGFHGVILATQTPEGMKGTLFASSGDSLQVRQAPVSLSRK